MARDCIYESDAGEKVTTTTTGNKITTLFMALRSFLATSILKRLVFLYVVTDNAERSFIYTICTLCIEILRNKKNKQNK
jgi:hypothetical protein